VLLEVPKGGLSAPGLRTNDGRSHRSAPVSRGQARRARGCCTFALAGPRNPQPGGNLQLANRLLGQIDLVAAAQLLRGQCGPKVGVLTRAGCRSRGAPSSGRVGCCRPVAVSRDQSHRTFLRVTPRQPTHLARRQTEPLSGPAGLQVAIHTRLGCTSKRVQIPHRHVTLASLPHGRSPNPGTGAKHCRNLTPDGHLNLARTGHF